MARSLTVKHEEQPATSALFTGFLVIAIACLLLSTLAGFVAPADAAPATELKTQIVPG